MSLISILDTLLNHYTKHNKINHPFIVGVDGLGGAGKTTFVKNLKEELKDNGHEVITIHMDDYIVESSKRYKTGYEEWYEYYYLQWNIDLLLTELFQPLFNGANMVNLPLYNRTNDTISKQRIHTPSNSIVLIEGIFIQRREWREFFNFVIFMDCPHKVRKDRVLNRDKYIGDYQYRLNKYQNRYWIAEDNYIEIENPLEKADVLHTYI